MKTLKTSNIILLVFSLVIIIFVILKIVNSTYHPNSDSKNAVYSELKTDKGQSFKYLVLTGYREVTYEVKTGNKFKIEVFTDPRNTDSCKIYLSNDTLYLNIVNNEGYTSCANIPDVKICIPPKVINILIKGVHSDFIGFQQDTLNIKIINNKSEFKSKYGREITEFSNINIKNCNLKTFNFIGRNSELSIDVSNTIAELNFNSKGKNSRLNLEDVIIGNLNLKQDSAEVILSGKAINYYLKK